jgi:hypothetical protein
MGLLDKAAFKTESAENFTGNSAGSPVAGGSLLKRGLDKKTAMSLSPQGISGVIQEYHKDHPFFQGIVLEMPASYDSSSLFSENVGKIISSLGSVCPLPARFCLILIPDTLDSELLSHRLARSFETGSPLQFRADSLDKAVKLLHSYL